MFWTFVTYKFADGMIAERSFPEGTACLVQLDIPDVLSPEGKVFCKKSHLHCRHKCISEILLW